MKDSSKSGRNSFLSFTINSGRAAGRAEPVIYAGAMSISAMAGSGSEGSLVQDDEGGTKTKRSNREHQLGEHLADAIMKRHLSYDPAAEWLSNPAAGPDDYVFTTPARRADR